MKNYYFADGTAQRGPFPPEELPRQGLRADHLVWTEGMPNWVPAAQVPELAAHLSPGAAAAAHTPFAGTYPPQATPSAAPGYSPPPGYAHPHGGYPAAGHVPYATSHVASNPLSEANSKKMSAGLLAILLGISGFGAFGVHKFMLGFTNAGIVYLLVGVLGGVLTCGALWGLMTIISIVEGIIYLTKSDAEFHQLYMVQRKAWF
jgi:TM2 domain-containing membrane protein YozV